MADDLKKLSAMTGDLKKLIDDAESNLQEQTDFCFLGSQKYLELARLEFMSDKDLLKYIAQSLIEIKYFLKEQNANRK